MCMQSCDSIHVLYTCKLIWRSFGGLYILFTLSHTADSYFLVQYTYIAHFPYNTEV